LKNVNGGAYASSEGASHAAKSGKWPVRIGGYSSHRLPRVTGLCRADPFQARLGLVRAVFIHPGGLLASIGITCGGVKNFMGCCAGVRRLARFFWELHDG